MAGKVNQARQDAWRERIERQRRSGRTIADFCRSEGISQASFHAWRRKLRMAPSRGRSLGSDRRTPATAPCTARGKRRGEGSVAGRAKRLPSGAAGFLELPVRAASVNPWIELALADGTVIRLPQQNTAALIAVLRVLQGQALEMPIPEGCHA